MTWSRARLEISGPLVPYAAGFTEWLGHKGYASAVVRVHQRRMIHLSRWMQTAGIDIAAFGPATMEAFIAAQCAAGRFQKWKAGSWAALLEYLESIGVRLADPPVPVVTTADALLARWAEYEATERGLAARSIDRSMRAARPFVECRTGDGLTGLEQLTAAEVTALWSSSRAGLPDPCRI